AADRFGLVDRGDVDHDDVRGVADRVDRALQVAEPITEIRTDRVDDLAQRLHPTEGVGVDRVGIGAGHIVLLLLVRVTATSATSTGMGACGLCTVTWTLATAS